MSTFEQSHVKVMQGPSAEQQTNSVPPSDRENGWFSYCDDTGVLLLQYRVNATTNGQLAVGSFLETYGSSNNTIRPTFRTTARIASTSGVAVNGFGNGWQMYAENNIREPKQVVGITGTYTDVTNLSEDTKMEIIVKIAGTDVIVGRFDFPSAVGDIGLWAIQRSTTNTPTLVQVTTEANDTAGAGFRGTKVPNPV